MKKLIVSLFAAAALFAAGATAQSGLPQVKVDTSAMHLFFDTAEKLKNGHQMSQQEWDRFFETGGYNTVPGRSRKEVISEVMPLVFNPALVEQRDSLLNADGSHWQTRFKQHIMSNFIDMQGHWDELLEIRDTYDFTKTVHDGIRRLNDFLPGGIDPEVELLDFYVVCYERDAHGREQVTMDLNLFYYQTEQESIDVLAHEYFHAYRFNRLPEYSKFIDEHPVVGELSGWQNEGIADMLDKDEDELKPYIVAGLTDEQVQEYVRRRDSTPEALKCLDSLTCLYARGEIGQKEVESGMEEFSSFLGYHANGRYLTRYIEHAGLRDELLSTFDSPFEFARIYNRAAEKQGGYLFSDAFMEYIAGVEQEAAEYK